MFAKIQETAEAIKDKMGNKAPHVGIILGSGLGNFAEKVEDALIIPYTDIPNFHQTTVVGHQGRLILGTIKGVEVAVMQGRFHRYEGHSLSDVVLPVRVLAQLGIKKLILTNASGGINNNYQPGELVCITDHINMTGDSPLIGPNISELGDRFPDMTEAYDNELNQILGEAANDLGIDLKSGIYGGVLGPAYETPAEINMLKIIGADMVGMSTVPECIAANHAGLKVCGVSCITNLAAGISPTKLSHDEVKVTANLAREKFNSLLELAVQKMRK